MSFSKLAVLLSILLSFSVLAKQDKVEKEVREFLEAYQQELLLHKGAELADRFDPRGYYKRYNGTKDLYSLEDVREWLTKRWKGPKTLSFKDVSIEVISPSAALIIAIMEWGNNDGTIEVYSYTGLLIKHENEWRIRYEDETIKPEQ